MASTIRLHCTDGFGPNGETMDIDPQYVRALRDDLNHMDADELRDRAYDLLSDGPEMSPELETRRWALYDEIVGQLEPLAPGRRDAMTRLRNFCFNEELARRLAS